MSTAGRSRLSLMLLVAMFLACAAFIACGETRSDRLATRATMIVGPIASRPPHRADASAEAAVQRLDSLLQRTPSGAEWRYVFAHLEHRSWDVAGAALRVLRVHRHHALANAGVGLLRRALTEELAEPDAAPVWRSARTTVTREALETLELPLDRNRAELLGRVLQQASDGQARTRALQWLAAHAPSDCERLVRAALADPSERVRLTALGIIAERRWTALLPAVEPLAVGPRPVLASRAQEVLEMLGGPISTGEDDGAGLRAAQELADELWRAGLSWRDVRALLGSMADEPIGPELLARETDAYLDRSDPGDDDSTGVLLLAAAVRLGHEKLMRRLWDHEIRRTDTNDELLSRGMEWLARTRLIAGLAACQHGDRAGGLEQFASVARLTAAARENPRLRAYVRQAGELSTAIWHSSADRWVVQVARQRGHESDPVLRLAQEVLGGLELNEAAAQTTARRRLDFACGLSAHPATTDRHRNAMAN